jgi:hypothetical protein
MNITQCYSVQSQDTISRCRIKLHLYTSQRYKSHDSNFGNIVEHRPATWTTNLFKLQCRDTLNLGRVTQYEH